MSGRILVTGASGFLGGSLTRRLVDQGRSVTGLARTAAAASAVESLGARPVLGDLLDRASLMDAMRDVELVFHAGGAFTMCSADPSPMSAVNVKGSRNVIAAAAARGIQRVVYTSSAATLGERRGEVGSETTVHRGWFLSHYERSKVEAERAVLTDAERLGLDVVCVNPSSVQGPGRAGGSARILLDYLNGRLPVVVDTRASLVDIDDCTAGHLLAVERGTPGRRYVLSGGTLTARDAAAILDRITGVRRRIRRLPRWIARAAGGAADAASRIRGRPLPLCAEAVRTVLHGHAYDGSRAERELGLRYTALEETLRRTVEWFAREGLLEGSPAPAGPGR